jgi:hypothetical protein
MFSDIYFFPSSIFIIFVLVFSNKAKHYNGCNNVKSDKMQSVLSLGAMINNVDISKYILFNLIFYNSHHTSKLSIYKLFYVQMIFNDFRENYNKK